ncbi:MAG: hypothetical protein P1U63_07995 [Coxiellaceae bacterium]|nr:hypothetical protein [Coxiellaceae bacterium]
MSKELMKRLLPLFTSCCLLPIGYASTPYFQLNNQTGSQNPLWAQVWWPSYHHHDNYLFTDADGGYSPVAHSSNTEVGLDYRRLFSQHWAVGAYGFAAFNRSVFGQNFYSLNPGIEFLNHHWHINVDGYFPLGSHFKSNNSWAWADSVGIYNYVRFQGHNQYNQMVRPTSVIGNGTDLIVSYRFTKLANIQASLGSYYFSMPGHPVGVVAKLQSAVMHHVSFSLSATHDPLTSNSINFGVTVHFGNDNNVSTDWINQPVQHNLPLNVRANSLPISNSYQPQGQELLQKDNVWFFSTDGTAFNAGAGLSNCTAENHCSGLNSTNLSQIATDAPSGNFINDPSIYLKPGTYAPSSLVLFSNESLIGRNSDYTQPAQGNVRATINTSTVLIDSSLTNNTTVANLQLVNNGGSQAAIQILGTANSTLDNLLIGPTTSSSASQNYGSGVFIDGATNVTLSSSTVNANNQVTGLSATVAGILVDDTTNLQISNSTINTSATGDSNLGAYGISITGDSGITINNSVFNQSTTGANTSTGNIVNTAGVTANININDSQLTATASGDNSLAYHLSSRANSTTTINRSTFTGNTSSTGSNQSNIGFLLYGNSALTLNSSTVRDTGTSTNGLSSATNIYLYDSSSATINDSDLFSSGSAALQTGSTNITATNSSTVTINGGTLETQMAGGPEVTEASGAVPLWALNNSSITVNDAKVIGRSLNSDTVVTDVQAENTSTVTVNDSKLLGYQLNGNSTNADNSIVIAGDTSNVTINNSIIQAETSGSTTRDIILVNAIGSGQINVNNSSLYAYNSYTNSGSSPIETIGLNAINSGIIRFNNSTMLLLGNQVTPTNTAGSGQIIQS